MNLDKIFYKKKIIITGHTGFKGFWLTAFLKTYGAKIYGISDGSNKKIL
jgi:CDP-glucose 4,6-dehydratase